MKTYLTPKEFADLFWHFFVTRLERYDSTASQCDMIIANLFGQYEEIVKENLEASMYGIEEFTGEKAIEIIGYQFHKSFRQVDVIPAKHIDSIIWSCMQDAPVFWRAMEKACKILVKEDAAELYKDEVW
jgi:hypothetical protein